tara:strand:- start:11731 stop:12759 length:1029 start_codon:yes stop_codon:yes gene_type:complete
MNIIVTGGAGFIGSALIRLLIKETKYNILNIDNMTYAANLKSLDSVKKSKRYSFKKIDICNRKKIKDAVYDFMPDAIMHLAAESHVDNSISGSDIFIKTNIIGTHVLLEVTREYLKEKYKKDTSNFRFQHISTDEVYGDLGPTSELFNENTSYSPSSPYSASKASSDHLVRAWNRTYSLPTLITNCSNNYGPYQFDEKLIPKIINNAIKGEAIPVYGNGYQIRDWLHVDDHVQALLVVLRNGLPGSTYNIGGNNEKKNIDVIKIICSILDELKIKTSNSSLASYFDLVTYVADRPGHDLRYAIDSSKIFNELNWSPSYTFEDGIKQTIHWYLAYNESLSNTK